MPYRREVFQPGSYYHIYNRGWQKKKLFLFDSDYRRFHEKLMKEVEKTTHKLHGYCLMPNHFHLLIQQITTDSLVEIIGRLQISYAKYFNLKHDHKGQVFEGRFGAKLIEADDYLLMVSRYIYRNPIEAGLVKDIGDWRWSSYWSYLGEGIKEPLVTTEHILSYYQKTNPQLDYREFILSEPEKVEVDLHDLYLDSDLVVRSRDAGSRDQTSRD